MNPIGSTTAFPHSYLLARADSTDATYSNLTLVFLSLVILGAAAILGFLIIRSARFRRSKHLDVFTALSVLWVVLTAGVAIHDVTTQLNWSKESALRIESGYYDPADAPADAPRHPWALYTISGAGYGILWFALTRFRRTANPS